MMALRIQDVPANDVPAALRFMREAVAGGWWDGDWMEMLLNMQRDPRTLLEAFADERKTEPAAGAARADSDDGGMGDDGGDWRADGLGSAHGYNPYRASDGKFGSGAHKTPEHHHQEAQRIAGEQRVLKEKQSALRAAGHKPGSASMVKLAKQHAALDEQRKAHQAAIQSHASKPEHPTPVASPQPAHHARSTAPEIPAEHRVTPAEVEVARKQYEEYKAGYAKMGGLSEFHAAYGEHFTPREDKRIPTPREYIAEQDSFSKGITRNQVFAFQHYEGSGFEAMNSHLRGKPSDITADQRAAIADMHAALSSHQRASDLVSFRGAAVTADHPLATMRPGDSFIDKAFTSSTIFRGHAEEFAKDGDKGIHFVITSPRGTHVAPMAALHANAREGEFVHDTNTKFTVTHREDMGDGGIRYHVQAESQ